MHESPVIVDQATRLRELALGAYRTGGSRRSHVLAVCSGKGGVGKSTVALNLAFALSRNGRSVILVDADENLANLDVMLGVAPSQRLGHVLRGERDVEDVLLEVAPSLRLLPGSSGEAGAPRMLRPRQVVEKVAELDARADFVIVDTGAGIAPTVLEYVRAADEAFIVTNSEPTAIMDAYAMIKSIVREASTTRMSIVMNGVARPSEADGAAQKLQTAVRHFLRIEVPVVGSIPYDPQVLRSIAAQEPVLRAKPNSSASLSLIALARQLMQQTVINEVRIRS